MVQAGTTGSGGGETPTGQAPWPRSCFLPPQALPLPPQDLSEASSWQLWHTPWRMCDSRLCTSQLLPSHRVLRRELRTPAYSLGLVGFFPGNRTPCMVEGAWGCNAPLWVVGLQHCAVFKKEQKVGRETRGSTVFMSHGKFWQAPPGF